jgi:autotransporter-associated beta strand protein
MRPLQPLRKNHVLLFLLSFFLGVASQSFAQNTYYWDQDATAAGNQLDGSGLGGTGTWNLGDLFWWNNADPNVSWPNTDNRAVFAGTAGTVTLGSNINAGGLSFSTTGYRIAGGAGPFALTLSGSAPSEISVERFGTRATIDAQLSGTNKLVKTGNGVLVLTNNNNNSGGVLINQGTLVVTNQNQLGSGNLVSVRGINSSGFGGGLLVLQGGVSGTTLSKDLSLAGRGQNFSNSSSAAFQSIGLANTLSGTTTFANNTGAGLYNNYGNLTISGNVVVPSGSAAILGGSGNIFVSGLVTGGSVGTDRLTKVNGSLASTLWLQNASNNYIADTRIDGGNVRVSTAAALGQLSTSSTSIDLNSGTIEIVTDSPNFNGRTLRVRDGSTSAIYASRAIGGSGLNQTVTFASGTQNSNSTLNVNGRNGYNVTFSNGATPYSAGGAGNTTINNNSSGTLTINSSTLYTNGDTTPRTFTIGGNADTVANGSINRTGGGVHAFAKAGTGTLNYQGTHVSSLTGGTTVVGTLQVSTLGGASGGSLNGVAGGQLGLGNGALDYRGAVGTGTGETTAKVINLTGNAGSGILLANQAGTAPSALTLTSNIGAGGNGSKTLFLGGNNTLDNTIQGVIQNNAGANITSLAKSGNGTWLYSPQAANYRDPLLAASPTSAFATSAIANTGQAVVGFASTTGLAVGQSVYGTNIPSGAFITAVTPTSITLNTNITTAVASGTALTFTGVHSTQNTTAAAANNGNTIAVGNASNLALGQYVNGANIPANSVITGINQANNTFTISNNIVTAVPNASPIYFGPVTNFTGNVTVGSGTLKVQPTATTGNGSNLFTTTQNLIFNQDPLTLNQSAGGTFQLVTPSPALTASLTQTMGPLTLTAGAGRVQVDTGGASFANTLNFASIGTRAAGATVSFAPAATNAGIQFAAAPAGLNGILGGYATILNPTTGAIDFVATPVANTNISALGAATVLPTSAASQTTNYILNTGVTTTANQAANSLRITGANALTLGGGLVLNSGGLVLDNSTGAATVSNGGTAANTLGAYSVSATTTASSSTVNLTAGTTTGFYVGMPIFGNANIPAGATVASIVNSTQFTLSTGTGVTAGAGVATGGGNSETMITVGGSNSANALTINGGVSAIGGSVTKAGSGTLVLAGASAYTGTTSLNEGTIRLSGSGTLGGTNAGLVIRQGATLDLNGVNVGTLTSGGLNAFNGAGTVTNSSVSSQSVFRFGNNGTGGLFSGAINDNVGATLNGAGSISVSKGGGGTTTLTGMSSFSGPLTITGGTVAITSIADIGTNSAIGRGNATSDATNAASLFFGTSGGTLNYTGSSTAIYQTTQTPSVSTNRLFTLAGNATIQSNGTYGNSILGTGAQNNAALVFSNTGNIAFSGTGARTLTLGGNSTGDNSMAIRLIDNPNGGALSVTKSDAGLWILNPQLPVLAPNNTYSGTTTINRGALQAVLGSGISASSAISFADSTGGVFQSGNMTATSITPTFGTAAGNIGWTANGSGGFAAGSAPLTVNISGTPTWGSTANFLGTGNLILNSTTALSDVTLAGDFNIAAGVASAAITTTAASATATVSSTAGLTVGQLITGNANIPAGTTISAITSPTSITLSTGTGVLAGSAVASTLSAGFRQIQVDDNGNVTTDFATITSNIGGTGALAKTGGGTLNLLGANTYSGSTFINNGTSIVNSIGSLGATSSSFGTNVGGGSLNLGSGGTTGSVMYVGPGETITRPIILSGTTGGGSIESSGSGALIIPGIINAGSGGNKTLTLRGFNMDANEVSGVLADNGSNILSVTKSDSGNWVLSGANTFTGNLTISGGLIGVTNANATAGSLGSTSTGNVVFSNGAIYGIGGPLTIGRNVQIAQNTTGSFTGDNAITVTNAVTGTAGNNWTINNSIASSNSLTFNGAFNSAEAATQARTLTINGTGNTVFNGALQGTGGTNGAVSIVVNTVGTATTTFNAAGLLSGTANEVRAGIVVLGAANALGTTSAAAINFTGGELRSAVVGTNTIPNNISLSANPVVFGGSGAITLAGSFGGSAGGDRRLQNNIGGGSQLTFGVVGLSTDGTGRTFTLGGTGTNNFAGAISNSLSGTSAGNFTYVGSGSVNMTAANQYTGTTILNGGSTTLSGSGSLVAVTAGAANLITVGRGASLTLDNTGTAANNRLGARQLTLNDATFSLVGHASTVVTESLGTLTPNVGGSVINLTNNGGSNTLTFATLGTFGPGASINFTGNVGSANNRVFITGAPTLTGGTNPSVQGLLAKATVDTVGGINAFATYNTNGIATNGNGIQAFTGYTTPGNVSAISPLQTLQVNGSTTGFNFGGGGGTTNAIAFTGGSPTVTTSYASTLNITSGGILATGGGTYGLGAVTNFAGVEGAVHVSNGSVLNVSGAFMGTAGFSKNLAGTLNISSAQYLSGQTTLSGGTTNLTAGSNTLFPGQALIVNPGATLDLNGNNQFVGTFNGGSNPGTGGVIQSTGAALFSANGNGDFAGQMTGAISFNKFGGNTLNVSNPLTYTGATTVGGGTLVLRDDATLLSASGITLNSSTLTLDNNQGQFTANLNRVADSIPLTLRGGQIVLQGLANTPASETLGSVSLLYGANTIQSLFNQNSVNFNQFQSSADLTIASLSRTAGATINLVGTNSALGLAGSGGTGGTASRIFITSPPATLANEMLGAWAIANSTDFAAYDQTQGVGAFGYGGFSPYASTFASGNVTQILSNAAPLTTTLAGGTTTTGALRLGGVTASNIAFIDGSDVLNLEMGGLLRSNQIAPSLIGTVATRGVLTAGGVSASPVELVVFNAQTGTSVNVGTAAATTSGSPVITGFTTTAGLQVGMSITNANFPAGTRITSIDSSTQITASSNASAGATNQTIITGNLDNAILTSGSPTVAVSSTVGLTPGMVVTNANLPIGTYVVSVNGPTSLTLSQNATSNASNQTITANLSSVIVNSVITDNSAGGVVSLVKSGAGTTNFSGNNTYTGGTTINQGTVNLIGSGVVIPAGGITLSGATLNMATNPGQIASSNAVTLNDSSTLQLAGNNTLSSLSFNNNGGGTNPTVNTDITPGSPGALTLTGAIALSVASSNVGTTPTINGIVNLPGATTFNVGAPKIGSTVISAITPAANIAAVVNGSGLVTKTGDGILQLSGQNTFSGGLSIISGGLSIGASSNPSTFSGTPGVPTTLTAGPLGTGTVTISDNATIVSTSATNVVSNNFTFLDSAGTLTGTGTTTFGGVNSLTLNGVTTLPAVWNAVVPAPQTLITIADASPSILGDVINVTGRGRLSVGFYAGTLNLPIPTVDLVADGNFRSTPETISLGGAVVLGGADTNINVKPLSSPNSFNKTLMKTDLTAAGGVYAIIPSNGYGLEFTGTTTLTISNSTFSVPTAATGSNVVQGLTLSGAIDDGASNFGLVKSGPGTLVLNGVNTFGGSGQTIAVQGGILSINSNASLGNSANVLSLAVDAATGAGLRATNTFTATGRTIALNASNNAIEVSAGNVLTLDTAFTLGSTANALFKNDNGVLELSASNPTWASPITTIAGGAIRASNSGALGSGAVNITNGGNSALQLSGGVTIANPLNITANGLGVNNTGSLLSVSGTNTYTGLITQSSGFTATYGAAAGATLNISGSGINAVNSTTFNAGSGGVINLNIGGAGFVGLSNGGFNKIGLGTLNVNSNLGSLVSPININQGIMNVSGSGVGLGSTGTITVNTTGTLNVSDASGSPSAHLGGRPLTIAGGTFSYTGNAGTSAETASVLTIGRGGSTFNMTTTGSGTNTLTFASLANAADQSGNFTGNGLGTASNRLLFTTAPTLVGGATAATNGLLARYTVNGSTFATYNTNGTATNTNGIQGFTGYNATVGSNLNINTAIATDTVDITSAMTTTNLTATKTLNAVRFSNPAGSTVGGAPLNQLVLTSGGILATGGGTNNLTVRVLNNAAVQNIFQTDLNTTLNVSSTIVGTAGLVKDGPGTLILSSPTANAGGFANSNTVTGTINVSRGTLQLAGGKNTLTPGLATVIGGPGATLDLNGTSQQIGALITDNANPSSGGTITSSVAGGNLVINQDNNTRTFAGSLTGSLGLTRSGQNTLTLSGVNGYTGTTLLNAGTTTLQSDGALSATTAIDLNYATLIADNNTGFTGSDNRINDSAAITIRGGTLQLTGRAQTASSEVLGAVSIAQGFSVINSNVGGTLINSADLSLASLSRPAGSSAIFFASGTNLGTIGSNSRITVGTLNGVATTPITYSPNGSGLTNNIVGGWAITNNDFLTYIPGLGLAALNQTGAAQYDLNNTFIGSTATSNIRLSQSTNITAPTAVNAVSMVSGQAVNLTFTNATDTLNITSGGLVGPNNATQSIGATVDSGRLTAGGLTPSANSDLYIYNRANTLTVNSRIIDNVNGSIVRSVFNAPNGTISLVNPNASYTGGTVLNGGTLALNNTTATPVIPAGGLAINGGTVTMNSFANQINSANVVTLNGGSTLNLWGNNTLAGLVFNNTGGTGSPTVNTYSTAANAGAAAGGVLTIGASGIVATSSNVGTTNLIEGRVDLGSSLNSISVDTINANGTNDITPLQAGLLVRGIAGTTGGFNKIGAGVLGLAAQSQYTGPTNVNDGSIRISVSNGGSRNSAYTLASGTRIDLAGNSTALGSIAGSGTIFNSAGTATLTTGFDNTNTSFSGTFSRFNDATLNAVALTKVGTGTLSLTGAQSAAIGTTGTVTVNGGTLAFSGATGAWFGGTASPAFSGAFNVNNGGILSLDNINGNLDNRLGLNTAGVLNIQGGTLAIAGNSTAATTETVANLNVQSGGGRVELTADPTRALTLAVGTLNNANGNGSLVIGGVSGATSAAGVPNLTIATPAFLGTQGGAGNGALTMSVRHDILGDASVAGLGTGFLVRDSVTNNFRALGTASNGSAAPGELSPTFALPLTADVDPITAGSQAPGTLNVGLSGSTQALPVSSVANTLTISGASTVNSGLGTAFGSYGPNGGLFGLTLSNAAASLTLPGATGNINTGNFGSTTAGTTIYAHVIAGGTLNVNGNFGVGNTAGFLKADGGMMNLNAPAYYTGATVVNGGTLNLNSGAANTIAVVPGATTPSLSSLALHGTAAVVNLNGFSQAVGALTSTNPIAGMGGTVTSATAANLTSTGGGTFAGNIGGALSFTRAGGTATLLTNANTYTGATVIRGGTLQLRDSGSILGTASITSNFGAVLVDNFGLNATPNPIRISASTPITLQGGTLTLNGAGSTDNTLLVNTLTVTGGQSTVNVLPQVNMGSTARITIDNLVRNSGNRSVVNFNGFSQNNSAGAGTLGGQGFSTNGNIILNNINGTPFTSANLTNNLIGGWAVGSGGGFATYVNGYGVFEIGNSPAGISVPGYDGTDITLATTSQNISDNGAIARIITGNRFANSFRTATSSTTGFTLSAGSTLSLNVGWLTNSSAPVTLQGADSTSMLTSTNPSSDLYVFVNQNTTNINAKVTGATALIKGGAGTLSLGSPTNASGSSNDYTLGTYVQAGTLSLNGAAGMTIIPAGPVGAGLVINNATVTQNTNNQQIAATTDVVLNGGGNLNLTVGTNTLNSLTWDNSGGTVNPTVNVGAGLLTLSSATPITASNDSLATTPVLSGVGGVTFANAAPVITTSGLSPNSLTISAPINTANALTKAGAGSLTLNPAIAIANATTVAGSNTVTLSSTAGLQVGMGVSGTGIPSGQLIASIVNGTQITITTGTGVTAGTTNTLTFSGSTNTAGFNLSGGSLIFGGSTNLSGVTIASGPIGTGTLSIAAGTSILSDGTARTIANPATVNGDFTFGGVTAGNGVTLSGAMNLGTTGRTITVASPANLSTISGAITSTATGIALTKSGAGILTLSSAANNFGGAGIAINGGILRNGIANALPNASPLTISAGAGYDLNGFSQISQQITGSGFITNSANSTQTLVLGGTAATDSGTNVSSSFSGVLTDNILAATNSRLALTKSGIGTLTLSNANTHSGVTTVNNGMLSISNSSALGTATGNTTVSSGASLELQGGITVGAEALTILGTGMSNSGALRNLSGTNVYGGAVTLGTGGATIQSDAGLLTVSGIIGGSAQPLTVQGTGNTTLGGVIGTTTGTLTKAGTGTLILSGANTYTGQTLVNDGTLQIAADNVGTVGSITSSAVGRGSLSLNGGGISSVDTAARTILNATTIGGNLVIGDTVNNGLMTFSSTVNLGGATRSLTVTSDALFNGVVSNGGITKLGTGTLTLSGANTYTGQTSVNGGVLSISSNANLGAAATGATLNLNDGTLRATATVGLWNGTPGTNNRDIVLGGTAGTFEVTGVNETLSIAGAITGTGGLTKIGPGFLEIRQATYTGATNVNAGTLSFGAAIDPLNSAFNVGSSGTLDINGFSSTIGSLSGSGTVTNTSGPATVSVGSITGNTTFSGKLTNGLSGGLSLNKIGGDTLTLTGAANDYTGTTTISGGSIALTGSGVLPATTQLTITSGSNFDVSAISGASSTIATLSGETGATVTLGSRNLVISSGVSTGDFTFAGVVSGTGGLTKNGTSNQIVTGTNTYTGATTISDGTLQLGNGLTTGSLSTSSTIVNNGNLTINRSNDVVQGVDFSAAAITGTGSLTKAGTGTTTLNTANTYEGGTTVSGGTLAVNNTTGSGTGLGTVSVESGATLSGTGRIEGMVTFTDGASHSPGNSPGVQFFDGGANYDDGSTLNWELIANTYDFAARGTSFDGITVTGSLTIGAINSNLNVSSGVDWGDGFWTSDRSWVVFTGASSVSFGSIAVNSINGGTGVAPSLGAFSWAQDLNNNNIVLNYTAVPEPTSLVFGLGLGIAGLIAARRRRLKGKTQAKAVA